MITDPHEIANVLGKEGIELMLVYSILAAIQEGNMTYISNGIPSDN